MNWGTVIIGIVGSGAIIGLIVHFIKGFEFFNDWAADVTLDWVHGYDKGGDE